MLSVASMKVLAELCNAKVIFVLQIFIRRHIPLIPIMFCFHDALFLYLRTVIASIIIPDKTLAKKLWAKYRAQINDVVK